MGLLYPLTSTAAHLDLQLPALSPDGAVQQSTSIAARARCGIAAVTQ